MQVATWNVLHDGSLVAIEGTVPGDVRLSVEIAYLCSQLPTRADQLALSLTGCERFEYRPYDGAPIGDLSAIAALALELLSAGLEDGVMQIECADGGLGGQLLLQYRAVHTATVEGQVLTQDEIELAAGRYWSAWQQRHGR